MIHIVNPQTNEILDYITLDNIIDDTHKKSLESYLETYDAIVLGGDDFSYDKHLEKRNHIIISDEDGTYQEFVLFEVDKYRDTEGRKTHFYAHATYLELKKAKIIYPTRREGFTLSQHAGWALNNTGWRVGIVESEGTRTFNIENHTNPYEFINRIAREFDVELRFRIEHDGRRITARYIDFLERIGDWKGREVEFGRDLDSIRRVEKQDIVTALLGLGPERDDGTRIEVLVEDEEALQRWGRVDEQGNLHHLIEPYEIQSERQEMTEEEARRYTRTALDKRINTQVTYETTILDLEEVPGLEHEKIRFGDTIRIKDTYFNPPLYLEARVFEIERSIKNKAKKDIKLGDYVEYTEEEVNAIWNQLRNEIRRRLDRMAIVTINSTAGNIFKNAQGETELTARTFVNGAERDEDGTLYDYQWMRFDKDGYHDTEFYAEGKTITVTANDIDEKATYRVLVAYELEVINTAEITISNVFDGEDGEPGPPGPKGDKGEDGKTFYTWIKYADTPTSGMSNNPEGKEYIGIAYNKETPTPSTNYADYTWSKFKGEQGIPGPPGEDGQPTYTWVKYADDEHGNGMSDSPDGKLYIGLAFNKTTPEESDNPADYTWSLMPQNIEIGGRNLLLDSTFNKGKWTSNTYTSILPPEPDKPNSSIMRLYHVNDTGNTNVNSPIWNNNRIYLEPREGDKITFSFDFYCEDSSVAPAGTITTFRRYSSQTGGSVVQSIFNGNMNTYGIGGVYGRWVRAKYTYTFTSNTAVAGWYAFGVYMSNSVSSGSSGTRVADYKYREIKIEHGDKATDWEQAPEDVQEQIDEAKQEAEEAKQEAQQAQTTADGKNTVFRQSSQPSTTGRKIGDVWFDTSRDNLMHVFNGTSWVQAKWGEQSIVANSITANHIKSLVGLNVNDQFIVDSQGNVEFAGHLEGATGTFNGSLTSVSGAFTTTIDGGIEIVNNLINSVKATFNPGLISLSDGEVGISGAFASLSPIDGLYLRYLSSNQFTINPRTLEVNFDKANVTVGSLYFPDSDGIHEGIELYGKNYIGTQRTDNNSLALYGNRADGAKPFKVRSHLGDDTGYRDDIYVSSSGNFHVMGRLVNQAAYDTTTSSAANGYVATNGYFARSTSSKRYKQDIRYCDVDYKKILNLKQASWYDKGEVERNEGTTEGLRRYYGAIAEDFERIGLSEYVIYNEETGEVENFSDRAWVLLIPNINDILHELKQIKERLERLENEGNSV